MLRKNVSGGLSFTFTIYTTVIELHLAQLGSKWAKLWQCLLQDNGLDIKAMPEFMHLSKDGVPMSGLLFNIIVENAV